MMDMTEWPDYSSNEGRNILREMYEEIADYEAEIERIRLNYEVTQWRLWTWSEPIRARRIRAKQRMKARARRTFEHIAADMPVGARQAFLRGCERLADNLAHCRKRCCNRARFWEGPNIQERRELDKANDMMKRSPHLLGPHRVDIYREVERRIRRKIRGLMDNVKPRQQD